MLGCANMQVTLDFMIIAHRVRYRYDHLLLGFHPCTRQNKKDRKNILTLILEIVFN